MVTSSTAAEAPAAQQASNTALRSDHVVSSSDAAEASHIVTQPVSKDHNISQEGTHMKRRSSRRHAGNTNTAQPAVAAAAASAGELQHSTDKSPQAGSKPLDAQGATPDATSRVAEVTTASAGRSSFRESARKEAARLQTQSEAHGVEQTRQEQVAAPHAAAAGSSAARWTRAGSVGRTHVKESSGTPSGSQERQSAAEQGGAGEPASSERDRRLVARRQQQAAAKPKSSRSGRGREFVPSIMLPDPCLTSPCMPPL